MYVQPNKYVQAVGLFIFGFSHTEKTADRSSARISDLCPGFGRTVCASWKNQKSLAEPDYSTVAGALVLSSSPPQIALSLLRLVDAE